MKTLDCLGLEQENALLRRTGGGRGMGADAAGDIATMQEEITNYRNQVQGLEEKNDEVNTNLLHFKISSYPILPIQCV